MPPSARRRGGAFARWATSNVELRVGDGTLGWPEAAPFDAILVAAGGPEVPEALKEQLAIGGRLVMPVGRRRASSSSCCKLTRTGEDELRGGGSRRRACSCR